MEQIPLDEKKIENVAPKKGEVAETRNKNNVAKLTGMKQWLVKGALEYFGEDNRIGKDRISQLALGAILEAEAAIDKSDNLSWHNVDYVKFSADAFRLIGQGLDFGQKDAYIVPYKNEKTKKYELTTPVSADGWVKLARMYSVRPIKDFLRFTVRDGDEVLLGYENDNAWYKYAPKMFNTGEVLGFLTVVLYEDGGVHPLVTTKEDVEKRRKSSKAPNSPAWTKYYNEMAMAKATRRHMKQVSINMPFLPDDEEEITKDMGEVATVPVISFDEPTEEDGATLASFDL